MKHVRTLTSTKKVEPVQAQDAQTLIAGAILLLLPKLLGFNPLGLPVPDLLNKSAS